MGSFLEKNFVLPPTGRDHPPTGDALVPFSIISGPSLRVLRSLVYKPVPTIVDFPSLEREILHYWEETRAFEKLRDKNHGGERYSFIDGPITANNPMGVHHAWGRTYKDLYQRYH